MRCFISLCVIAIWFFVGMIDTNYYEIKQYKCKVHAGDTLDGIASEWYSEDERNMSWQEFRYRVIADNSSLTKNNRYLQVGDTVVINVGKRSK